MKTSSTQRHHHHQASLQLLIMLSSIYILPLLTTGILALPAPQAHPTGVAEALLASGSEYQNAVLFHHNFHRQNHNAAPLTWDNGLANNALIAAQKCVWAHYIPPGVANGQNIYANNYPGQNVTSAITETWYKGEFAAMGPYWGQEVPNNVFPSVGHLTQILWKGTTSVGCVSYDCGTKMIMPNGQTYPHFTVCNYSPPGNVIGSFGPNVAAPIQSTNLGTWSM